MKKTTIIITIIYLSLLVFFQTVRFFGEEYEKAIFIVSNILFTLFVILNMYSLRNVDNVILNPLFLASLKMFLLAYGATIFYIYTQDNSIDDSIAVYQPYPYMNNAMIYASIGFISMWYSYNSKKIQGIAHRVIDFITFKKKILREDLEPRWFLIYVAFFLSIVFKLILISLGVYGVISTILAKDIDIPFLNILIALSSAGSGALLFLYLYYFKTGKKKTLFIVFFLVDFFFSILTGFKGAIVMSILVLAIAYYVVNTRIRFVYLLYTIISIQFAYSIVTPYRNYMINNPDFDGTSLTGIVRGFIKSYEIKSQAEEEEEEEKDKYVVLKRFNFIPEITKFQEYKIEKGLKEDDPDFVFLTLMAPVQVFIPRFLWENKPKSDLGRVWVTQKVFGLDYNSSTAFGPIGFLYLTGGAFAIFLGFIVVGFVLQVINLFFISGYWGGKIIALALLYNTISMEAQFNFYITDFMQALLFVILFQFILFKKIYK